MKHGARQSLKCDEMSENRNICDTKRVEDENRFLIECHMLINIKMQFQFFFTITVFITF